MSKPREKWWGYVKNMLRAYPKGCTKIEEAAINKALDEIAELRDGQDRRRVAEMVFFKRTHTLDGAAQLIPCSYATARRYQNDLIQRVAVHRGLKEKS